MTDLFELTAAELAEGYRARSFTPLEATQATLDAIASYDESVNAFVLVDEESALAQAKASTARFQEGHPVGSGDGIPTSIKDIFYTAGWPTLRGTSLIDEEGPWEVDAPCVARLREAGAVLVGKTATPEFAWKGVTDSQRFGSTGNPWAAGLTSGGSSGGSATAVGLGMGPWSVGTDGGGSVRIPASFTGTVALKPTFGLVPMYPASPFGTLAHAGPMTRTVRDAALLLDIISGFDARDWAALATPSPDVAAGLDARLAGLRIAFSPTLGYVRNDPEVDRLVRQAVLVLEELGAQVEEVEPGFGDPVDAFHTLWFCGAAKVVDAYGDGALERVDPGLRAGIERWGGATAGEFLDATAVRMDMGVQMGEFHQRYDLLITPTMPIVAFPRDLPAPEGWHSQDWTSWTPYTYPFNMTQQPAASIPCGWTAAGLPVGLQIVGPRHADRRVLDAAYAYEQARGWRADRPAQRGIPSPSVAR